MKKISNYTLKTELYQRSQKRKKIFYFQKNTRRTIRQENSCCCKIKYKRVQIVINGTLNLGL